MNEAKVYSVILEIEGHPNGKDTDRKMKALQDIKAGVIEGHDVVSVIDTAVCESPARVSHYGYDYRCSVACPHETAAYSVLRYFGVYVVLIGTALGKELFGTYQINPYAQLIVCGFEQPATKDKRHDMSKVS